MEDKQEFEKHPALTEIIQQFACSVPASTWMWSKLLGEINNALKAASQPPAAKGADLGNDIHDRIITHQMKGMSLENAIYTVGKEDAGKGAVWVDVSNKQPDKDGKYKVQRIHGDGLIEDAEYSTNLGWTNYHGYRVIKWLCESESPTDAGDGKEDLAFIAAVTEEGAEAWKMEYDSCRKILQELVDLKDLKESEGKTADYMVRQPVAWIRAKRFLENYTHVNL